MTNNDGLTIICIVVIILLANFIEMQAEKLNPGDNFKEFIKQIDDLKSKINPKVDEGLRKLGKGLEKFEKESNFIKAKNTIRSDYGKFLSENDIAVIGEKFDSKKKEVVECFKKYEKLNEPKPKFLPFLLGIFDIIHLKIKMIIFQLLILQWFLNLIDSLG